jgi:hypothetical protein
MVDLKVFLGGMGTTGIVATVKERGFPVGNP